MKTITISIFALLFALGWSCGGKNQVSPQAHTAIAVDSTVSEEAEMAFVREFYASVVLHAMTDSLPAKCTPALLKELEKANDYDGGGYAVWLFRTCANGNLNDDDRVLSVTPQGDHRFEVRYMDGGVEGCTVVETVVTEDGIKMSAIVKRDKGCEGEGV